MSTIIVEGLMGMLRLRGDGSYMYFLGEFMGLLLWV